jgi:Ner family transcriptional regulator
MTTKRVPKKPDDRRVWVKHQLELAGASFADIGRELKVSRQAVRKVSSERIARAIARKIGLPPEQIWPERYRA